jgi:CRISPR-associated endonuclease/helicase Cas3
VLRYIAHKNQALHEHLEGVAELAKIHAGKIGMGNYGELMGLLHDFGKYSAEFQKYIMDAIKKNDPQFNPDEDEDFEDPTGRKGKIDHSTAGAQFLSHENGSSNAHRILKQFLSLCLVSHHSGLINCLTTDNSGTWDSYSRRLSKNDNRTRRDECTKNADKHLLERINAIFADKSFTKPFEEKCRDIVGTSPEITPHSTVAQFQLGLLVRFLFSALIDADRQDTADSEKPKTAKHRLRGSYKSWCVLIERLENKYNTFETKNRVDEIRKEISSHGLHAAQRPEGLFTLSGTRMSCHAFTLPMQASPLRRKRSCRFIGIC